MQISRLACESRSYDKGSSVFYHCLFVVFTPYLRQTKLICCSIKHQTLDVKTTYSQNIKDHTPYTHIYIYIYKLRSYQRWQVLLKYRIQSGLTHNSELRLHSIMQLVKLYPSTQLKGRLHQKLFFHTRLLPTPIVRI